MIQAKNLTKRYGGHLAVDDLTFTVEQGSIYGLLGPNGAGKSTTMNILTGYISASEGTVTINGFDLVEQASQAKSCIGYLPEQPPLYADMTPAEYLCFVAELKKIEKKQRALQVEQAMERTGVVQMQHRLIRNLSKGYRQRVGIAAALLGDPKVIILDEPTVGLDPAQVIEVRSLIRQLARKHTVILSSHILSEVNALCDHLLIIARGKLVAQGTPAQLAGSLKGETRLTLTALGKKETVLAAVQGMEGVLQAEVQKEENGETSLALTLRQECDLRAEISAALAAAGCPVLALATQELSLEDVFLQLTADTKPGGATRKDKAELPLAEDVLLEDTLLEQAILDAVQPLNKSQKQTGGEEK